MQVDCLYEKGTGDINEDFHFIDGNLFGVFDGATSLSPAKYENGLTGGFIASNVAGKTFKKNNDSLKNLTRKANRAICDAMINRGVNLKDKGHLWSTSAAVVRLGEDVFEWIQIGDCLVLVIYEDGTHEILSKGFNHDLETLTLWKRIADKTEAPILAALKEQIFKVRSCMNVTYGSLSGEEQALDFANFGTKKTHGIKHILLFTDGLFIPKCEPEKREDFQLFSQLFLKGGLSHIRDVIRRIEKTDLTCRTYPRFKAHDDIAAISITL